MNASAFICGLSTLFHNKENRAEIRRSVDKKTGEIIQSNRWAFGFSFAPRKVSPEAFTKHVLSGGAFTVGQFDGTTRTKATFLASYLLAMDIDNKVMENRLDPLTGEICRNEHGVIIKDEKRRTDGYISYQEVLKSPFIQEHALIAYPSPSCTADWHKFRLVFLLSEPVTDGGAWETLQRGLMQHCENWYPDKSCKDAARLYFGSTNRVYEPHINLNAVLPLDKAGRFTIDMALEENNIRSKPPVDRSPASGSRLEAYANVAYASLLDEMQTGDSRHDALLRVGTKMFEYEAGGWPVFTYSNIERDLYQICASNGFIDKYSAQEFQRCLNDARDYGKQSPKPKELPDRALNEKPDKTIDLNAVPDSQKSGATVPESEGLIALALTLREIEKSRKNGDIDASPQALIQKADMALSALKKIYCPSQAVTFRDAADKTIAELQEAFANSNPVRGIVTDITDLDKLIGGWRNWLILFLGATGSGKSTMCASLLRTFLNCPGLVLPTENTSTVYLRKIVASMMRIPSDKIEDGEFVSYAQFKEAERLLIKLTGLKSAFLEGGSPTPVMIENAVKEAVEVRGAKWLILDSISKLAFPGEMDSRYAISAAIDLIQDLTIKYGLTSVVTSQVGRQIRDRANKRPQLDDGAESSQLERNADVVLTIYNHWYYVRRGLAEPDYVEFPENTALITLEKHRHRDGGGIAVQLAYVGGAGFYSLADKEREMK